MPRTSELYRVDALFAIDELLEIVNTGGDSSQLDNRLVWNATLYLLLTVGEAIAHLPPIWFHNTDIDPNKVIGVRNLLAHGYYAVDPQVIWGILQNHLIPLKQLLEQRAP